MWFFREDINQNTDYLIPSYRFVSSLKEERKLYFCPVSEVSDNDLIFDIKFLKITDKKFNNGFHFKAEDLEGNAYNAYVSKDQSLWVLDPSCLHEIELEFNNA